MFLSGIYFQPALGANSTDMFPYNKPISRKCDLCGKQILAMASEKLYCQSCAHLLRRIGYRYLSQKAKKCIRTYIRKNGFTCDYSGIILDLKDYSSPWYCVFSCPDKRNPDKMVLAAALFNAMKMELIKQQFRYYVLALHDNRTKHTKIKRRPIINWDRLKLRACCICGQAKSSNKSIYCPTCAHTAHRLKWLRLPAKTKKAIWDYIRQYGYVCYYTGIPLDFEDYRSAWYFTFEHVAPGESKKVVLASALLNEMKSDLSENEFWYYIKQLYNYKKNHTKIRKRKLVYWYRLNQVKEAGEA